MPSGLNVAVTGHCRVVEVPARASGSLPTIAGPLTASWVRSGRRVTLDLAAPVNTTIRVLLPASSESAMREGAVAAVSAPGVVVLSVAGGQAELSVGSGSYRFTSS